LVTGAGGTIGAELCSQILQFDPQSLILVERSEYALYEVRKRLERERAWATPQVKSRLLDIRDDELLEQLVIDEKPNVVLHAAAHKHVPLGEENPSEYLQNNTVATRSLAEISARQSVE